MKKTLSTLLTVILACMLLVGCSNNAVQPAPTEAAEETPALVGSIPVTFPLVSAPKTLKVMITAGGGIDQENVFVWKKYEEMTGVDVVWTNLTKDTRTEAVHTALTNNRQVDLILRCKLSSTKLLRYGQNDLILDLAKDGLL